MLHRDRAERRERGGLMQHALGEVRLHAHAFPLAGAERPGLVPDRIGDAEPAEVVHQAGAAQRAHFGGRQSQQRSRRRAELRDRARVAERVRRLQIDEVRDREQRRVELLVGEHDGERRLGRDHRIPRPHRVEAREDLLRAIAEQRGERGIELLAAALARQRGRRRDAADAVRDLDELRELRDARRDRHVCARQPARPAAPVPLLVGRADARDAPRRAGRAAGRRLCASLACASIMPSTSRCPEITNSSPIAEAMQRRVARAERARGRRSVARTLPSAAGPYLRRLHGDVVAEPLGLLVRIRVTTDVDQQRRVVDVRARVLVEPELLGQAQRDQALPQHVLHRLPEPEIDPERQRSHQLRETNLTGLRFGRAWRGFYGRVVLPQQGG